MKVANICQLLENWICAGSHLNPPCGFEGMFLTWNCWTKLYSRLFSPGSNVNTNGIFIGGWHSLRGVRGVYCTGVIPEGLKCFLSRISYKAPLYSLSVQLCLILQDPTLSSLVSSHCDCQCTKGQMSHTALETYFCLHRSSYSDFKEGIWKKWKTQLT